MQRLDSSEIELWADLVKLLEQRKEIRTKKVNIQGQPNCMFLVETVEKVIRSVGAQENRFPCSAVPRFPVDVP